MAIDEAKAMSDLEGIAKTYAFAEEESELDVAVFGMMDVFVNTKFSDGSTMKYEVDGVPTYKKDLSGKQKTELADNLFKSMVQYSYLIRYGGKPEDLDGFMKLKDKANPKLTMADSLTYQIFGVGREGLRKTFEGMDKLDAGRVNGIFNELKDGAKEKLEESILTPLKSQDYAPYLSKFLKKGYMENEGYSKEKADKTIKTEYGGDILTKIFKGYSKGTYGKE